MGAFERNSGGTLFSFDVATGSESVLHSFGSGADGAYPIAALLAYHGWLYGTTVGGGPDFSTCVTSGEEAVGAVFAWRLSTFDSRDIGPRKARFYKHFFCRHGDGYLRQKLLGERA